ncbi:YggS family pyridoxal phosphate-dependent enzyme [Schaalia vaccimaxillae]|uniref:YggS family pyridoxal phosphate-dependent enzyme n=1 Tax=Schaalia vaccimaxillae TaxID=183916 RepID=UPI0003B4C760|nr:YggS family pyridoxal phosphate-dependent enzyme [Schaalia vaccimaxillae]
MMILEAIEAARQRIDDATAAAGRSDTAKLELAVKTRTPDECRQAAHALSQLGQPILLGHNRVQEARETLDAIRAVPGSRLHLIGPLQTNKINHALACIDALETLDSPRLAAALDKRLNRQLDVFIEVNVSGEVTKHGCQPSDVPALVDAVAASQHLMLAGLMTVGLNSTQESSVRRSYAHLRNLRDQTCARLGLCENNLELSMGMSADLEWAIAEGATIVRLGTAIFGQRR